MSASRSERPEPPRCPYCGEEQMVEVIGYVLVCDCCGRPSAFPRKIDAPAKGN
jgi:hypothetical protein